ncbi:Chromosome-partitioning protein ParB [compost metagenome]
MANSLRLLKLPSPVRDMLSSGTLSAGHARALIPTSDPTALAKAVVAKGMSVRDAERLAQNDIRSQSEPQTATKPEKDSDTVALERTLTDSLGLEVKINHRGGPGQIRISYKTLEQLEEICRLLERR